MKIYKFTALQLTVLVTARVLVGWYFLYEGVVKLMNPNWTSIGFLMDSKGPLSGFFISLATNTQVVPIVDFLNIWGLIAIGLGLILGCLTRIANISAILLLTLYYISHPPIIGASYALPAEGNYLWVNKTLLEICLLSMLAVFPTGHLIGLDRLLFRSKR